jgi:ribosomal protein S18 acetylase RimI-like enzyme
VDSVRKKVSTVLDPQTSAPGAVRAASPLWASVRRWPGDPSRLALTRTFSTDNPSELARFIAEASTRGISELLTGALDAIDVQRYSEVGFSPRSQLVVLERRTGLTVEGHVPRPTVGTATSLYRSPRSSIRISRASRWLRPQLAAIDKAAFGEFWHLDSLAIADAQAATPRTLTRLAHEHGAPIGYALWGIGDDVGYLQRLAVVPHASGVGVGSQLVQDGLRRLDRRVGHILVNTEVDNYRALALYERHGFVRTRWELQVVGLTLGDQPSWLT